ncbi:flavodoxin family protein, partial [uncultured Fusobacterium sp.]
MKTLITYSTKTGNTKKVAEAISKAITNSEIMDIADVQNL